MKRCIYALLLLSIPSFLSVSALRADGKKFVVVIDPGHGGKDPGTSSGHLKEKTIVLDVALKLGAKIQAAHPDVKVIYTRKTDRFIDLTERANIANRNKADLFISLHVNSVKRGTKVHGAETYVLGLAKSEENLEVAMTENSVILLEDNYEQRYEGFDPGSSESYIIFDFMQNKHLDQSIFFGSEIQKSFTTSKRANRGVRQAGFLVLKATSMPSVLVELGFITNPTEAKYLSSERGKEAMATDIYKAFVRYKNAQRNAKSEARAGASSEGKGSNSAKPPKKEGTSVKPQQAQIVYKVQLLSSTKKLPPNSRQLKGYKAVYYQEGSFYKYTYGESTKWSEIKKLHKQAQKDFSDAFIICTQHGKRVKCP